MSVKPGWILALILILYAGLVLPTVRRYGIAWDEQVDLDIARSYLSGEGSWFRGSSFDASQARLPMYTVAAVFALTGTTDLTTARLVSVALGAVTILAVYCFCRWALDRKTGLLAALILATSPFFLSFARVALTESDIFVTCALAWFLVCLSRLLVRRNLGWAVASALTLGLAVSSKISALSLAPLALLAPILAEKAEDQPVGPRLAGWRIWLTAALMLLLAAAITETWWLRLLGRVGESGEAPEALYAGLLSLWAGLVGWLLWNRRERVSGAATGLLVLGMAYSTFFLLPPVHVLDPRILLGMARRAVKTIRVAPGFPLEAAEFHAGCVLFKSSPILGALLWVGVAVALLGWRKRKATRPLVMVFVLYVLFLLRLNIAQTFYMMPLLPVMAIAASDAVVRLKQVRSWAGRALLAGAFGLLAFDLTLSAPDYQLNGYQYLGARILGGRSTLGYRGIVQVTTDGVQQSLEWINRCAGAGQTVAIYILAHHIVRAVCPQPAFRLRDGVLDGEGALDEADWVVTTLNAEISDDRANKPKQGVVFDVPYDRGYLEGNFRKVFVVRRSFDLEVAAVWKRRAPAVRGVTPQSPAESGLYPPCPPTCPLDGRRPLGAMQRTERKDVPALADAPGCLS